MFLRIFFYRIVKIFMFNEIFFLMLEWKLNVRNLGFGRRSCCYIENYRYYYYFIYFRY